MADRHRMSGPKGGHKKKRAWRPKSTKGKITKLAKEVKAIKKEMREEVEVKNYDDDFALASIDYDGSLTTNLLTMQQGTDVNERIGTKVTITGCDFRYVVAAGTTTTNSKIRVMMIRDKENVLSAVSNFLVSTQLGTSMAPLAFFNRIARGNFEILYDKLHEFDYGTGNLQQIGKVTIPKKFEVEFLPGVSTLVSKNAVRMIAVSDTAPAGGRPTLQATWRFYYTDQ